MESRWLCVGCQRLAPVPSGATPSELSATSQSYCCVAQGSRTLCARIYGSMLVSSLSSIYGYSATTAQKSSARFLLTHNIPISSAEGCAAGSTAIPTGCTVAACFLMLTECKFLNVPHCVFCCRCWCTIEMAPASGSSKGKARAWASGPLAGVRAGNFWPLAATARCACYLILAGCHHRYRV